jgi:radical SAM superfamily enzyme YgiQ (UPF0313 family)
LRILLINTNTKDDILASPPIGLSYVATATEEAGHEVRVLDLCFRKHVFEEIKQSIVNFSPQLIGMSIRNIDNVNMLRPVFYLDQAKGMVEFIRSVTDVPIVLGGSAASLNPEGILHFTKGDYIVVSDGEETLIKLVKSMENGTPAENITGVGRFVEGKFEFIPPDLKEFPTGTANLGKWIDMKPYSRLGSSYTIQSKRGCRERCIYCVYQMIQGHRLRMRSPRDVVDEIEEAFHKFNISDFEFIDSIFNDPEDHAVEILEEICRRPWNANFSAIGMDPKGLNDKFLDLMWKAGFRSFMLSPESACDTVIKNYGKGFVVDDLVRAAEAMNKTRLTPFWYFLVGGPGETNQTLDETLGFILKYLKHETHPPYHNINMFMGVRIYPGTGLWNIGLREGLVNESTDPLQPCWYLSESLDIDLAIKQMVEAASLCPELYLGIDERYLSLSKVVAFFGELFKLRKPYWRHIWGINRLLIKTGLRFAFQTKDVASILRTQLKNQGYRGPLLKENPQ